MRATMAMEHRKWRTKVFDAGKTAPVFICGLARSGSTLLLNRLMATGRFSTSTYRHMPFVLAPSMWSRASQKHQKAATLTDRAHGDGMEHGFDSEEAFEEVFWRAVSTQPANTALLPFNDKILKSDVDQFRLFMTSVTAAGPERYLSKNNNNVARIGALLATADTATVLVPFRHPVHFAGSTLAQHRAFLARHTSDRFAARYMSWLGHHEFGPYFKPVGAAGVNAPSDVDRDVTADYLCNYWSAVYSALLQRQSPRVHFFDYDGFCANPDTSLAALGRAVDLPIAPTPPPAGVHAARRYDDDEIAKPNLKKAMGILQQLRARALA